MGKSKGHLEKDCFTCANLINNRKCGKNEFKCGAQRLLWAPIKEEESQKVTSK